MNWKSILKTVAPTLATALGGPLAGMAVKTVAGALLGDESAPQSDVEAALLGATPADLAKLKDIDATFKVEMEKLKIDLAKVNAGDRENARQREIQTGDNAPKVLSTVIVVGFFAALATIAFVDIPTGAQQPVSILLGALTAMLTQVGNYYFGSSAGSAKKTELLGRK